MRTLLMITLLGLSSLAFAHTQDGGGGLIQIDKDGRAVIVQERSHESHRAKSYRWKPAFKTLISYDEFKGTENNKTLTRWINQLVIADAEIGARALESLSSLEYAVDKECPVEPNPRLLETPVVSASYSGSKAIFCKNPESLRSAAKPLVVLQMALESLMDTETSVERRNSNERSIETIVTALRDGKDLETDALARNAIRRFRKVLRPEEAQDTVAAVPASQRSLK